MASYRVDIVRTYIDDRMPATIRASSAIGVCRQVVCKDKELPDGEMLSNHAPSEIEVLRLIGFSPRRISARSEITPEE